MSIEGIELEKFSALPKANINTTTQSHQRHAVFHYILINDVVDTYFSLSNEIKRFLCALVVAESCLISSDKNIEILHDVDVMV